ncbi:MAG TPA: DUF819 family protein [Verrucomicrobiales bacterium]|nr:DUF819 family protein [Verrucomicrobiales bacterium]
MAAFAWSPVSDPLPAAAAVCVITAAGYVLSARFQWAAMLGPSLLVLILGALASNLSLLTPASPVYGIVQGPVVSMAIVWLLLAINLKDLRRAGIPMLSAFAIGVVATCICGIIAGFVFRGVFPADSWKLAGVMTATYSGGSLNFVAAGSAVDLPTEIYGAAQASDNVLTALWFAATLTLPILLGRWRAVPSRAGEAKSSQSPAPAAHNGMLSAVRPIDIASLGALALLLIAAAQWTASRASFLPEVVWLTTFALLTGQIPVVRRLRGAFLLGHVALHLFFTVIGISSVVSEILRAGPGVFGFTALVVFGHGFLLFGVAALIGRMGWGLGWDTVAVASQAAVGGPSTAMALAASRKRPDLVGPGMAAGLLGYAVGTYLGLGVASLVRVAG